MDLRIPDDAEALSDRELEDLHREAVARERTVSGRRRRLQDRVDFLRAGGGATTEAAEGLLDKLLADEQEVSQERRALHGLIDRLGHELRRRRGRA